MRSVSLGIRKWAPWASGQIKWTNFSVEGFVWNEQFKGAAFTAPLLMIRGSVVLFLFHIPHFPCIAVYFLLLLRFLKANLCPNKRGAVNAAPLDCSFQTKPYKFGKFYLMYRNVCPRPLSAKPNRNNKRNELTNDFKARWKWETIRL